MSDDAKFEDGDERPLFLGAQTSQDLEVLAALCQDAIFPIDQMRWQPHERRLAILLNRFRWEKSGGLPERVQSLLVLDEVRKLHSQGIDKSDDSLVLSLLSVTYEPGENADHVTFLLSGDGAIRAQVEALEMTLRDVTRPYHAPSGKTPEHS